MTVYIAGPMTGLEDYNFPAFKLAQTQLESQGHKVLNPAKIGILPDYEMYWPINKAMLDGSDAICMLEGWMDSQGARKELEYATALSLEVMFYPDRRCCTCAHSGVKDFVYGYCKHPRGTAWHVSPDDVCDFWDQKQKSRNEKHGQ